MAEQQDVVLQQVRHSAHEELAQLHRHATDFVCNEVGAVRDELRVANVEAQSHAMMADARADELGVVRSTYRQLELNHGIVYQQLEFASAQVMASHPALAQRNAELAEAQELIRQRVVAEEQLRTSFLNQQEAFRQRENAQQLQNQAVLREQQEHNAAMFAQLQAQMIDMQKLYARIARAERETSRHCCGSAQKGRGLQESSHPGTRDYTHRAPARRHSHHHSSSTGIRRGR